MQAAFCLRNTKKKIRPTRVDVTTILTKGFGAPILFLDLLNANQLDTVKPFVPASDKRLGITHHLPTCLRPVYITHAG